MFILLAVTKTLFKRNTITIICEFFYSCARRKYVFKGQVIKKIREIFFIQRLRYPYLIKQVMNKTKSKNIKKRVEFHQ